VAAAERLQAFSVPGQFPVTSRQCERLHTIDPHMSKAVMARIQPFLPELMLVDGVRWRLADFTHHWRYVRYQPGGHFRPHYDGAKMLRTEDDICMMSCFTVQIYLNEDYAGGSTQFYSDYQPERKASHPIMDGQGCHIFHPSGPPTHRVLPEVGKALLFSHVHNTLHEGEPVMDGVKYICRGDVLYSALPEDIPLLLRPLLPPEERMFCLETAGSHGTRNYVGQVWLCACGLDHHGRHHCLSSGSLSPSPSFLPSAAGALRFVLVSGKRAAGKDHMAKLLEVALAAEGLRVVRTALGSVNKRCYAAQAGIDPIRLETDREFKVALGNGYKPFARSSTVWPWYGTMPPGT
jgi:hypothetical protein